MQQIAPQPPALSAPGSLLTLPAPLQQRSQSNLLIGVKKLRINGNRQIPTGVLQSLVQAAEGRRLTLGALQAYVERITTAYHQQGYPLAYAYLPAQTVQDGVIRVEVVEPRYDRIEPTGKSRLRGGMTRWTAGVKPGDLIESGPLERGLLLLSQTPGVQIKGMLVPGAQPGTSTLRIERHDEPVITGTVSENNYGNRYTGTYLTNASMSANNPFGYGSSLSVNGIISNTGGLKANGFDVTSPDFGNGLRAGVYGSASFYKLGGAFNSLDQVGRSTQIGGDLSYPVILMPGRLLNVRFDMLQDWMAQSTRSVQKLSTQSILLERLSIDGALADHWNGTNTVSVALSHGQLTLGTASARASDASGPKTSGSFVVGQIRVGRTQSLPYGLVLSANLSGQLAGKNLDSSQQFFLGGPYGIMSYAVGDGGGDEGYLLRTRLSHALPIPRLPGALSGSLLAQTGTLWLRHTQYPGATGPEQLTLSGVGAGLSYHWRRINVSASYIRRVGANAAPGFGSNPDALWFEVGLSL